MIEPQVRLSDRSKYPMVGFVLKFTPSEDVDYRSRTPLIHVPGSQWQIMRPEGQAVVLYGSSGPPTVPLSASPRRSCSSTWRHSSAGRCNTVWIFIWTRNGKVCPRQRKNRPGRELHWGQSLISD